MSSVEIEKLINQLESLKFWLEAICRRLDYIEGNAFLLEESEEVVLVTVPRKEPQSNK
jgi:hypothetical protein